MLTFTHLSATTIAGRLLFSDINISLTAGEINCLTGPNGSGKTTLLNQLYQTALQQGYCALLLAQKESDTMAPNSSEQPGEQRFSRRFTQDYGIVGSPGELRSKDLFAQLDSVWSADLILLDEPGNHLDTPSFERFLVKIQRVSVPLLIVTHDRRLLRFADKILHLEEGQIDYYSGGYEQYRQNRKAQIEAKRKRAEFAQKSYITAKQKLHRSVEKQAHRRSRAEAWNNTQKNPLSMVHKRQNQADRTAARLEKQHKRLTKSAEQQRAAAENERMPEGRPFGLELHATYKKNQQLILARNILPSMATASFQKESTESGTEISEENPLWKTALSFTLAAGESLALTGKNGSGKTTLLRILAGEYDKYNGELIHTARSVYFHRQVFHAVREERVIDVHQQALSRFREDELRTALAHAGFRGTEVFRDVHTLSGGEWCRLQLARASLSQADLVLLDEPTNDLDELARYQLLETLQNSSVSYIIVTHDLEFLDELGLQYRINLDEL